MLLLRTAGPLLRYMHGFWVMQNVEEKFVSGILHVLLREHVILIILSKQQILCFRLLLDYYQIVRRLGDHLI